MPGKYIEYIRAGQFVVPVELKFIATTCLDETTGKEVLSSKWVERKHWKEIKNLLKPAIEECLKIHGSITSSDRLSRNHHVVSGKEVSVGYILAVSKEESSYFAILDPKRNCWTDDEEDNVDDETQLADFGGQFKHCSPTKVFIQCCVHKKSSSSLEDAKLIRKELGIRTDDMRGYLKSSPPESSSSSTANNQTCRTTTDLGKPETPLKWKKSKESNSNVTQTHSTLYSKTSWKARRAQEISDTEDGVASTSDDDPPPVAKSLSSCVLWQPKTKQLSYYSENILDKCRRMDSSRESSRSRFSDGDDDGDSNGEHYEDLYSFYDVNKDSDDDFSLPDIDMPLEARPAKEPKRKRKRKSTKSHDDTRKSRKGKRLSESISITRTSNLSLDPIRGISPSHSITDKRSKKANPKLSKKLDKENKQDGEDSDQETGLLLASMFGKKKRKEGKASSPIEKKKRKEKTHSGRSKRRKKETSGRYERLTPSPFPEIDPDMPVLERMDEVEDTSLYIHKSYEPAPINLHKESSGESTILIDGLLPPPITPVVEAHENLTESHSITPVPTSLHQESQNSSTSYHSQEEPRLKKKTKKKKHHRSADKVLKSTPTVTQSTGVQCIISASQTPPMNDTSSDTQQEPTFQVPSCSTENDSPRNNVFTTSQSEDDEEVGDRVPMIPRESSMASSAVVPIQNRQNTWLSHRPSRYSTEEEDFEPPVGKLSSHMPAFGSPSSGDGDDPFSFDDPIPITNGCGYNCGGCNDCDNMTSYHSSTESESPGATNFNPTILRPSQSSPTPSTSASFTNMPPPTRRPPRTPKKNMEHSFSSSSSSSCGSNSNPSPCSSSSTGFSSKPSIPCTSSSNSNSSTQSVVETDLGAIPTYQLLTNPKLFRIGIGLVKQLATRKMTAEQVKRRLGYMDLDETTQESQEDIERRQRRAERELSPDIVMLTVPERIVKQEEEAFIVKEEEEITEALSTPVTLDCESNSWRRESSAGDVTDNEGGDLDSASECDILELGGDALKELFCRLDHHERPHSSVTEYQPRGDEFDMSQRSECFRGVVQQYEQKSRVFKMHAKKIHDLTFGDLLKHFNAIRPEIQAIFTGKITSRRHEIFKLGHYARKKLHDLNVISLFDNDHAMTLITFLYEYLLPNPEERLQYNEYITYVMLPEAFIRIFARVNKISIDLAEKEMTYGACYDGPPAVCPS